MTPQEPVLSEARHGRLIKNIDEYCERANIPKAMLYESAKPYLNKEELGWLVSYPVMQRKNMGLLLTGKHSPSPDKKMMAMTAALMRNFQDARILTVKALLSAADDGEVPSPTVLMVPNLYVRQGGKGLPAWQIQILYDILISRYTAGKISVVYCENMDAMAAEYGHLFTQHLESNYVISVG